MPLKMKVPDMGTNCLVMSCSGNSDNVITDVNNCDCDDCARHKLLNTHHSSTFWSLI
jgi:hypothetical protein